MSTSLQTHLLRLRYPVLTVLILLIGLTSSPAQVETSSGGVPTWRLADVVAGIPFGKDERFFKWEARTTRTDGEGGDVVLKLVPTDQPQCQRWYRLGWTFSGDISTVELGDRVAVYLTAQLYNESDCETYSVVGTSPSASLLGRNGDRIDPSPLIAQTVQNDPDPTSRAYLFYATHPAPMILGDPQPSYPPNQEAGTGTATLWIGGDTDVSKAFARTANGGSFTITIEARGVRYEVVYLYDRADDAVAANPAQPDPQTQTTTPTTSDPQTQTTSQPEPVQTQPEPNQTQPGQVQPQPEPVQTQPEPNQTQTTPDIETTPNVPAQPTEVVQQPEQTQPQTQDPDPEPVSAPRASALMDTPVLNHNIQNNEGVYFIGIQIPGTLDPAGGSTAQIMVQFLDQQNQPLPAAAGETVYRSPDGHAMTASEAIPLSDAPVDLGSYNLWMPYYALNLPDTGGETAHELKLYADIYVDNQFVARSTLVPFTVRW